MKWNSDLKDRGRPSFKCNALSLRRQGKKCKNSHAICTNRNITQFSQIDQSVSWYKTSLFQELKQAKEILEKPPVLYPGAFSAHCNSLGRAEPQFPKTSHNIETSLHDHEFKTRAKNSDFSHNCQGFTNVFILKAESDSKS